MNISVITIIVGFFAVALIAFTGGLVTGLMVTKERDNAESHAVLEAQDRVQEAISKAIREGKQ